MAGRGRGGEPEETVCGVPALKVLSFVFLGQRNPLQPLPAWPCSTHKRPVGAPHCGYCSDDCHMCYETESDVLGGSWGGGGEGGGFQGSLLPLLVLMPVPELHPSPHHSIPPSNLPAPGVISCSFFNPGYHPESWPERDSAFSLAGPSPAQVLGTRQNWPKLARSTRLVRWGLGTPWRLFCCSI